MLFSYHCQPSHLSSPPLLFTSSSFLPFLLPAPAALPFPTKSLGNFQNVCAGSSEISETTVTPLLFPRTAPRAEWVSLDPLWEFSLESLRAHIISQPLPCVPQTKTAEHVGVKVTARDRTASEGESDNLKRRLKVMKFLEKARKRRKMRVPCRVYEGRKRAARNKPRENGKFVKSHWFMCWHCLWKLRWGS